MFIFNEQVNNWKDWGKVFQSIPAFKRLVEHIFEKEALPMAKIEKLTPGTNAVFKVGAYVIKIYAPAELGDNFGADIDVDLFGIKWVNKHSVPAPKFIANGEIKDKYHFKYMIMEYINGKLFSEIEDRLSYDEKFIIGKKIRAITDKLNKPCENFTSIDLMQYALKNDEWGEEGFPASFQAERLAYIENVRICDKDKVYCHGDLHVENILIDDNLDVYIIDFGDAMYAPAEYEQAYVVSGLFCFGKPYMMGYYGNYNVEEIVNLCMTWLPIHVWGHSIVSANLKPASEITSFDIMRKRLYDLISRGGNMPIES